MKSTCTDNESNTITVTPLAGVWIEISLSPGSVSGLLVTPLAGVWIEIVRNQDRVKRHRVTPLAGVWIEIARYTYHRGAEESLPLRECGLK